MRRLCLAISLLTATVVSGQTPCDRACLISTVDSYVAALVAHDPTRVALAKDAKFTEDEKVMSPGDGLWKTISEGPTKFKVYVPDPLTGQVGFLGVFKARPVLLDGSISRSEFYPYLLALRLKVQGGQITESEALVNRSMPLLGACESVPGEFKVTCELRRSHLPNLETVRPGLLATLSPAERGTREQMLRIADSYYESIVRSDGNVAPYADDCVRRENGVQTTSASPEQASAAAALIARGNTDWVKLFGLSCAAQAGSKALSYITSISRRVQIADPETGLVFALSMFRRPYVERTLKIVGVPGVDTMALDGTPSDRVWAHVFKISGGKLHEIEAMGAIDLPLNSKSGWEDTP